MPANKAPLQRTSRRLESSIPVLKKSNFSLPKKTKGESSELNKYYEAIVKASRDDDDDVIPSEAVEPFEPGDYFSKSHEWEKRGGDETHDKLEKKDKISARRDAQKTKLKSFIEKLHERGNQTEKTSNLDRIKNEIEIKKGNKTNTSDTSLSTEIENFLEKFYPNPYSLGKGKLTASEQGVMILSSRTSFNEKSEKAETKVSRTNRSSLCCRGNSIFTDDENECAFAVLNVCGHGVPEEPTVAITRKPKNANNSKRPVLSSNDSGRVISSKTLSGNVSPNEHNSENELGKLVLLTLDDSPLENEKTPVKMKETQLETGDKSVGSALVQQKRPEKPIMLENSAADRRRKIKARRDVRALNELVDSTNESLLKIADRNKTEMMDKMVEVGLTRKTKHSNIEFKRKNKLMQYVKKTQIEKTNLLDYSLGEATRGSNGKNNSVEPPEKFETKPWPIFYPPRRDFGCPPIKKDVTSHVEECDKNTTSKDVGNSKMENANPPESIGKADEENEDTAKSGTIKLKNNCKHCFNKKTLNRDDEMETKLKKHDLGSLFTESEPKGNEEINRMVECMYNSIKNFKREKRIKETNLISNLETTWKSFVLSEENKFRVLEFRKRERTFENAQDEIKSWPEIGTHSDTSDNPGLMIRSDKKSDSFLDLIADVRDRNKIRETGPQAKMSSKRNQVKSSVRRVGSPIEETFHVTSTWPNRRRSIIFDHQNEEQAPRAEVPAVLGNSQGTTDNRREELHVEMVEVTNELGGYNEEKPERILLAGSGGEIFSKKNLLPLSVRIKKRNNESSVALKKALEKEEKLLVNHILDVQSSASRSNFILSGTCQGNSGVLSLAEGGLNRQAKSAGATICLKTCNSNIIDRYPFFKNFSSQNPHFVICVNSLPRNLRTILRRNIIFASSFSVEPSKQIRQIENVGPSSRIFRFERGQALVSTMSVHSASAYNVRSDILTVDTLGKAMIFHTSALFTIELVSFKSLELEGNPSESSQCWMRYLVPPRKNPSPVDVIDSCPANDVGKPEADDESFPVGRNKTPEPSVTVFHCAENVEIDHELTHRKSVHVATLVEEIKRAEESIQLLERNIAEEVPHYMNKLLPWCGVGSLLCGVDEKGFVQQTEASQNELHEDEDLLTGACDIQENRHCRLHKVCSQPLSSSSSGQQIPCKLSTPNLCVLYENNVLTSELPLTSNVKVISSMKINSKSIQTDESFFPVCYLTTRDHLKERTTSQTEPNVTTPCRSPSERQPDLSDIAKSKSHADLAQDQSNQVGGTSESNLVLLSGRSSASSFKSSNDLSESSDVQIVSQDSSALELKNLRFFRKIFHDLDLFRKKLRTKRQTILTNAVKENFAMASAGELTGQEEGKPPPKILKTIFKGKESVTELAIGLKDVPMSSISVEKKKYSPNHTKISISIVKDQKQEKSKTLDHPNQGNDSTNHKNECQNNHEYCQEILSTNVAHDIRVEKDKKCMRCDVDSFKNGENLSWQQQRPEEDEEEDDDDFKSVASSFTCDSELGCFDECNLEVEPKPEEKSEPPRLRPFQKHRFDFYQKMSSVDFNVSRTTRSFTNRYNVRDAMSRELEPLKQALTDMQMRMRSIKQNSLLHSHEYYDRALRLAKMSAGYCQNCGNRAVIPEDTFGYYKSILPRRYPQPHLKYYLHNAGSPSSSFYSFRSSTELNDRLCDIDL